MKKNILLIVVHLILFFILLAAAYRLNLLDYTRTYNFKWHGQEWEITNLYWFSIILLLPYLSYFGWKSYTDLPKFQIVIMVFFRLLLLFAIALALSNPKVSKFRTQIEEIAIVDVSRSITDSSLRETERYLIELLNKTDKNHSLKVITFAKNPRLISVEKLKQGGLRNLHISQSLVKMTPDAIVKELQGTNIEAAFTFATSLLSVDKIPRTIVFSDGNETEGNSSFLAEKFKISDLKIDNYYNITKEDKESLVEKVEIPDVIKVGEPFNVRANIWSNQKTKARLKLYQNGVIQGLNYIREVDIENGENIVTFESKLDLPGPVNYKIVLDNLQTDRFPENNTFIVSTEAVGKPTICYVEGETDQARYLERVLSQSGFDVEVRGPRGYPTSLDEMRRFSLIILSDIPSDNISTQQMMATERYVRDWGGGFIMIGGPNSFGLGGYRGTIIERILPVRMDTQRQREEPVLALVLVIDKSGSMAGLPVELAKDAAIASVELLSPDDMVGVVAFDSIPTRIVTIQRARNRMRIYSDIGRLTGGGGTNIYPALDMAYQDIVTTNAKKKHIILLSDGQSPSNGIPQLLQQMTTEGITVSTVGLGGEVDRALLTQIAQQTGGRTYFTDDPNNIPRIFSKETNEAVRNAAVEDLIAVRAVSNTSILNGINFSTAPYLRGYVTTQLKPPPAELILASELGEPILARWRVGLGWAIAFTSDVKPRWAVDWLRWSGFGMLWSQLVRESIRQEESGLFPLNISVIGDKVHVYVDAMDDNDNFINGLKGEVEIFGTSKLRNNQNNNEPLHKLALKQVAPGRYEGNFALPEVGTYLLKALYKNEDDIVFGKSRGNITYPYPREFRFIENNYDLMDRISNITGGLHNPDSTQIWNTRGQKLKYWKEMWHYPLWIALILLILDIILKRVRLGRV